MLHGRVVELREHEAEAELVDRLGDAVGLELEPEAQRLEHVGRARGGGDGAVPVLRDARPRCCRHDRGGGRDVQRAAAVAAGAGRIDEVAPLRVDGDDVLAHCLGATGDLVGGLALCAQRREEGADLRGRRLAAHDLAHHPPRLLAREAVPVDEAGDRVLDGIRRHHRTTVTGV